MLYKDKNALHPPQQKYTSQPLFMADQEDLVDTQMVEKERDIRLVRGF
jgi:hypothetical protein